MRINHPVTDREYVLRDGAVIVSKTDTKGRITYVNDEFVTVSGFTEAELMRKAHNIVRHPDMPEEAFADLWRTLEAGKPWTGLVKNRCKNGDYYWVLANATPMIEDGVLTGYMSVRSKPARDQVAAAEAAYRLFRENKAAGLAIREGKVVSASRIRALWPGRWATLGQQSGLVAGVLALAFMAAVFMPATVPAWLRLLPAVIGAGALAGQWFLMRQVAAALRASASKATELAQGRFERIFEAEGADELASLQYALQSLRTRVGFELSDSRRMAQEGARIRQALDAAAASVMIADTGGDIIYANPAVRQLLENAATDIRERLPAFDATTIVGTSIDRFHANPGHQRSMLEGLRAPHSARIEFGRRKLDLTVTPVRDTAGVRLGTVVEWRDRTAELTAEAEVEQVVRAAQQGDLTQRIPEEGKSGFFAALAAAINAIIEGNAALVREVQAAVSEVTRGAEEIATGNLNLSQRTEEQASSLEETASSMEEMTSSVRQNADNAALARQLSATARGHAESGGTVATDAVTAMQGIHASSARIGEIIGVIDGIAFQTNLLALNAAVEAARAGDQGRGFAVVASEVRSLASRSAEAAKEIRGLIQESVDRIAHGCRLVDESGKSLHEIVGSIKKVSDIVAEIASASAEQASGIEQVNKAIMQMDEVTQHNAALVEESAAAAQSLTEQANRLNAQMAEYRVREQVPARAGGDRLRVVGGSAASRG